MTLILTQSSKDLLLQVTDRLVTGNRQPYNECANKNILYCASNEIVVMGQLYPPLERAALLSNLRSLGPA